MSPHNHFAILDMAGVRNSISYKAIPLAPGLHFQQYFHFTTIQRQALSLIAELHG